MTIYALIDANTSLPAWTVLSGASILQGGNPYFVPDFAQNFEAYPSIALRVGKLGKGISTRFADRYVDGVAPCAVIAAVDLLKSLQEAGLPWTPAVCYDRSLALGRFTPCDFKEINDLIVTLRLASDQSDESLDRRITKKNAAEAICAISSDNTLKTGDIIVLPWGRKSLQMNIGAKAMLLLDGEESVKFNIR